MERRQLRCLVSSVLLVGVWPFLGHTTATATRAASPPPIRGCSVAVPRITLLAPANAAVETPKATIHFGWKAVPCAAWYNVEVWLERGAAGQKLSGAAATITAQRVNMNTYILPSTGWAKGVYAWRVIAAMADGSVFGTWSASHTFTLQ
jgi:hypothetical protein